VSVTIGFKGDAHRLECELNRPHKAIARKVCDYLYILKVIYNQIFDEFILSLGKLQPRDKIPKKD